MNDSIKAAITKHIQTHNSTAPHQQTDFTGDYYKHLLSVFRLDSLDYWTDFNTSAIESALAFVPVEHPESSVYLMKLRTKWVGYMVVNGDHTTNCAFFSQRWAALVHDLYSSKIKSDAWIKCVQIEEFEPAPVDPRKRMAAGPMPLKLIQIGWGCLTPIAKSSTNSYDLTRYDLVMFALAVVNNMVQHLQVVFEDVIIRTPECYQIVIDAHANPESTTVHAVLVNCASLVAERLLCAGLITTQQHDEYLNSMHIQS